jgi:hypothetical protein
MMRKLRRHLSCFSTYVGRTAETISQFVNFKERAAETINLVFIQVSYGEDAILFIISIVHFYLRKKEGLDSFSRTKALFTGKRRTQWSRVSTSNPIRSPGDRCLNPHHLAKAGGCGGK